MPTPLWSRTACSSLDGNSTLGIATPASATGGPRGLSFLEVWTFADTSAAESVGYGFASHLADVADFVADTEAESAEVAIPEVETMTSEDLARYESDYFGSDDERVEIVERDGSRHSVPGGGCLGMGRAAVFGDIKQQLRLEDARETARSEIWSQTLADEAVVSALENWTDCVARQGYEFDDPPHSYDTALAAAQSGNYDEERNIATVAAECTSSATLNLAVEAAYLVAANRSLAQLEADLVAYRQVETEALTRARDILRGGRVIGGHAGRRRTRRRCRGPRGLRRRAR